MTVSLASDSSNTILGYMIPLDGDGGKRSVWLAKHDGDYFVIFTNAEGGQTRLKLSPEAMAALVRLYNDADHPGMVTWRLCLKAGIGTTL